MGELIILKSRKIDLPKADGLSKIIYKIKYAFTFLLIEPKYSYGLYHIEESQKSTYGSYHTEKSQITTLVEPLDKIGLGYRISEEWDEITRITKTPDITSKISKKLLKSIQEDEIRYYRVSKEEKKFILHKKYEKDISGVTEFIRKDREMKLEDIKKEKKREENCFV